MEKVIGIDLGTTNSCVAIVEDGNAKVIPNKGSYDITPSIVAIAETGRRLVGHMAKRQAVTNSTNTAYAFKRLIGRKWDSEEVKNLLTTLPYTIVPGTAGDIRVVLKNQTFTIAELSAFILQEMKEVAEDYIGEEVSKAVVTVPAYFSDSQRQATKDAGKIAGLDVIRIINEPTAAALSYGFGKNVDQRIAIYDLGGGTFDISVLDIGNGVYQVLATAGDSLLGGEDFDRRIIDWLVFNFAKENHLDLRKDKMAMQRLKDVAERAKCELSSINESEINLPFIISTGKSDPLHLNAVLTRDKLEQLTADLVQRTIRICKESLEKSGIDLKSIDSVILAGGMTRMPMIQQAVSDFFKKEPNKGVHPDEVVALGAAIQGNALISSETEKQNEILLLDVTSHSLGIKLAGGIMHKIIEANTTIPTSQTEIFSTTKDNQKYVDIIVYQGESDKTAENELLGKFTLTGLRPAPKGEVDIEVTFDIDANGIVKVLAKDMETGKAQSITISSSSNLSKEELNSIIRKYNPDVNLSDSSEQDSTRNTYSSPTDKQSSASKDVPTTLPPHNTVPAHNQPHEDDFADDLSADMMPLIDSKEEITQPLGSEIYETMDNNDAGEFGNLQTVRDDYFRFGGGSENFKTFDSEPKNDAFEVQIPSADVFEIAKSGESMHETVRLNKGKTPFIENTPSVAETVNLKGNPEFTIKKRPGTQPFPSTPSSVLGIDLTGLSESKMNLANKVVELLDLHASLKDKLLQTNYGPDALKKADENVEKAKKILTSDSMDEQTLTFSLHEIDRTISMFKNIMKYFG